MLQTIDINIVLIVVFFTWHYALRCGYVSDDHATVEQRKDIIPDAEKNPKKESYWLKVFNDGIFTHYFTHLFWKLNCAKVPFVWHAVSLGLHLINTYLLYLVLSPIVGFHVAMIAVLYWAVNPMLNQNVVWVSGRPYLYAVTFGLVGMLFWDQPLIFIPCYLLAITCNISIFFIPVLVAIVHPGAWQGNLYLGAAVAFAVPFIIWKFHQRFTRSLVIDRENFRFKIRKVNTLARIYAYYVYALFVPVKMGWYHQAGFRYNIKWEKFNIWTLCGYGLVGLLVSQGLPGYWFLLGMLPNSNTYATNSFVQDRYTYFASIGIALIVAPILIKYPGLFYVAMTFYITRAYMYSRHLKNDELLYRENWRNHPRSDYAINNLVFFLIYQKRWEEARVTCLRGLEIEKTNKMLWYNLGITWAAQGNFINDEGKFKYLRALDCWKMALQIEPRWGKPAEDIKKLIGLLVEHKVLTTDKDQAAGGKGFSIDVPNIRGLSEMIEGTKP